MGLYSRYVLPKIVHLACGSRPAMRQRKKVVPAASGTALEVGIGSGLNLQYYDPGKIERVYGLDPSLEMTRMAAPAAARAPFDVDFLTAGCEEIPLPDRSVDTVLVTYTLCTLPDPIAALRETRRVLRPGGRLLFCEHGLAPDENVSRWQRRIDPVWRRFAGGCHLSRNIPALLDEGGYDVTQLDTMYIPGWRPASFNYWGSAVPR